MGTIPFGIGEVAGSQIDLTGDIDTDQALLFGSAMGMVDAIMPNDMLAQFGIKLGARNEAKKYLSGGLLKDGLFRRMAEGYAKGSVTEGITETVQEAILISAEKWIAPDKIELFGDEVYSRLLNSAVGGALVGGPVRSVGSAVEYKQDMDYRAEELNDKIWSEVGEAQGDEGVGLKKLVESLSQQVFGQTIPIEELAKKDNMGRFMQALSQQSRNSQGVLMNMFMNTGLRADLNDKGVMEFVNSGKSVIKMMKDVGGKKAALGQISHRIKYESDAHRKKQEAKLHIAISLKDVIVASREAGI